MEKLIDLHTHSNYSDGEYSPQDLINLAIKNNIGTIALTDHDTIDGIKTVDKEKYPEIRIINGIELTAKVDKGRMHILGYNIDLNNRILKQKMAILKDNSLNSVLSIYEQIKKDYGIYFHYDDLKELINANHNLGRPDLAKLCIKYGYAKTVSEAFDKYLIAAYNKIRTSKKGLSYEEVIDLIKVSGGIPVLAHPKSLELSDDEFRSCLVKLMATGLQGIEVYHSSHSLEEMLYFKQIAQEYNLLISGGSDYHGPNVKPDIELGTGKNKNLCLKKLSILDKIP